MSKSRKLVEFKEKKYSQVKGKKAKTEFHYQYLTTGHSLTYLKLSIETGKSCK